MSIQHTMLTLLSPKLSYYAKLNYHNLKMKFERVKFER